MQYKKLHDKLYEIWDRYENEDEYNHLEAAEGSRATWLDQDPFRPTLKTTARMRMKSKDERKEVRTCTMYSETLLCILKLENVLTSHVL
ncbi:hypothetical protein DPMN_114166 [Dreissena polymorpha]|uniref:Uncharacterized protein n=1 Tax=Dreissena polymorpha TaxID=45954 RepID=A0A9D4KJD6_DREPO|nr:hypothetical protein DPMN_114166 [Dreissena polymorpha]